MTRYFVTLDANRMTNFSTTPAKLLNLLLSKLYTITRSASNISISQVQLVQLERIVNQMYSTSSFFVAFKMNSSLGNDLTKLVSDSAAIEDN